MVGELKHIAMTKSLTEEITVYGSKILSVHLFVCTHQDLFNRGFCHIKTVNDKITLWADEPFKLVTTSSNREWKGVFTTEIINGKIEKITRNFQ